VPIGTKSPQLAAVAGARSLAVALADASARRSAEAGS